MLSTHAQPSDVLFSSDLNTLHQNCNADTKRHARQVTIPQVCTISSFFQVVLFVQNLWRRRAVKLCCCASSASIHDTPTVLPACTAHDLYISPLLCGEKTIHCITSYTEHHSSWPSNLSNQAGAICRCQIVHQRLGSVHEHGADHWKRPTNSDC